MSFFRRNNRVRVHFVDQVTSVEGVLHGKSRGHYILWCPKVLQSDDQFVEVSGHVEIPASQVLFIQVIR